MAPERGAEGWLTELLEASRLRKREVTPAPADRLRQAQARLTRRLLQRLLSFDDISRKVLEGAGGENGRSTAAA